jgi:peptide subunit release factor 1 (eRF1)
VNFGQQLTRCPGCRGSLIQIESSRSPGQVTSAVERRCPECGHRDELLLVSAMADLLDEHAAELAASLEELADRLEAASELWISDPS